MYKQTPGNSGSASKL